MLSPDHKSASLRPAKSSKRNKKRQSAPGASTTPLSFSVDQLKELIAFAAKVGASQFSFGELHLQFANPGQPLLPHKVEAKQVVGQPQAQAEEELKQALEQGSLSNEDMLFWSSEPYEHQQEPVPTQSPE